MTRSINIPTMKRLVIRADDAGSSLSANSAVFECASRGLARSLSLMAPGPFIEDAAQVLAGLPNVDFGLHLTLSAEWDAPRWGPVAPVESVPLLLDELGSFTRAPNVLFDRGVSEAMLDQIELEAAAQLQRLRDLRFNISYLDEHMGVGWLPGARDRLQVLAARHDLHVALPVRHLPYDGSTQPTRESLLARLDAVPEGDWLLVTHPAFDDEEMRAVGNADYQAGQVARERDQDRRLLLDDELRRELERRQVLVARYSDVLG